MSRVSSEQPADAGVWRLHVVAIRGSGTIGLQHHVDCRRVGVMNGTQIFGTQEVTPLVAGERATALVTAFQEGVITAFGRGGSVTAVIGFDPEIECMPQTGQSFATTLRSIATSPDDVFPICGDYAPALDRVRDFVSYLVDTELELVLEDTEAIESVQIEDREGALRPLDPTHYRDDRELGVLLLEPNALGPTDVGLSIELEKGCVPHVD